MLPKSSTLNRDIWLYWTSLIERKRVGNVVPEQVLPTDDVKQNQMQIPVHNETRAKAHITVLQSLLAIHAQYKKRVFDLEAYWSSIVNTDLQMSANLYKDIDSSDKALSLTILTVSGKQARYMSRMLSQVSEELYD